jgi:hypothetical protein
MILLVTDEKRWVRSFDILYSTEAECIAFILPDLLSWIKPATKTSSFFKPAGSVKLVVLSLRGK